MIDRIDRRKVWLLIGLCTTSCALFGRSTRRRQPNDPLTPEQTAGMAAFAAWSKDMAKLPSTAMLPTTAVAAAQQAVLLHDPEHQAARYNVAVLQMRQQDANGLLTIRRLAAEDPPLPAAQLQLAARLAQTGDLAQAEQMYRRVADNEPKDIVSRLALAQLAHRAGRYNEAIDWSRQVLAHRSDALIAFQVLSSSCLAQGKSALAELVVARGLKVDPTDPTLLQTAAQILLARADDNHAVVKLKELVVANPNNMLARLSLGHLALKYADGALAVSQFASLSQYNPIDPAIWLSLGIAKRMAGQYPDAEAAFKKTAELGKPLEAWWNLEILYEIFLKDRGKTTLALQQLLALLPAKSAELIDVQKKLNILHDSGKPP